jgi:hypothetical protein
MSLRDCSRKRPRSGPCCGHDSNRRSMTDLRCIPECFTRDRSGGRGR